MRTKLPLPVTLVLAGMICLQVTAQDDNPSAQILKLLSHPEHSQGEMAGHMTATSVILQTRLTLTNQA